MMAIDVGWCVDGGEIPVTPEQKCIGFPERKYINDAGKKAPDWRPSLQASGLGGLTSHG